MSLSNPNKPVTEQRLQEFYHKIEPYLGGGGGTGGGGHTIEDSEGTDLTQRDTLQFGEGFIAEDDDTNEKTVISPDVMQSGDMDDVITPLPSIKAPYTRYSTTEQVVGEWIDGKKLYQKTVSGTTESDVTQGTTQSINLDTDIDRIINIEGFIKQASGIGLFFVNSRNNDGSKDFYVWQNVSNNNNPPQLRVYTRSTNGEFNSSIYYLTIQYTKTTD